MDQVYAKIKKFRVSPLRKLVSAATLFDEVGIKPSEWVDYSSEVLLEDDQWFSVGNFSERSFFPKFLEKKIVSADIDELKKDQFEDIAYLVSDQGGNLFFQRVMPNTILRKKLIVFGDVASIEDSSNRIVVNPQPDAIWLPENGDMLVFRDIARISPMFPGIDSLFKEATRAQVREFLNQDFINAENLDSNVVSKPNRKRIALAIETLGRLSQGEKSVILTYINHYCSRDLKFDEQNKTFTITSNEDLKSLLYGVQQRFYTTEIFDEKRLANSVIRI